MKTYGRVEVLLYHSSLDECEWSASRPGRFTPGERITDTHWIGGWMGPRASLYAVEKRTISCPLRKSNPGRPPLLKPSYYRGILVLGMTSLI
jgi:hypothetical protein